MMAFWMFASCLATGRSASSLRGDRYERAILVEYLLGECRDGFFACGFDRDDHDADLFLKTVRVANGSRFRSVSESRRVLWGPMTKKTANETARKPSRALMRRASFSMA
ncbi:MAG: hypothetical protein R3B54_17645 [Bdellovibrionota bacterium]